jgi:hypothetical protein
VPATITSLAVNEHIADLHRQAERSRRACRPGSRRLLRLSLPRLLGRRVPRAETVIIASSPVSRRHEVMS